MIAVFHRPEVRVWFIALALSTLLLVGLRKSYEVKGAEEEAKAWDEHARHIVNGAKVLDSELKRRSDEVRALAAALETTLNDEAWQHASSFAAERTLRETFGRTTGLAPSTSATDDQVPIDVESEEDPTLASEDALTADVEAAARRKGEQALQAVLKAHQGVFGVYLAPVDKEGYASCYARSTLLGAEPVEETGPPSAASHLAVPPQLPGQLCDSGAYIRSPSWLDPLADGAGWKTFVDSEKKTWYAQYAVPFFWRGGERDGRLAGLAFIRVDYNMLRDLVRNIGLGDTGYGFLMTQSGELIDHPHMDESDVGDTLFNIASNDENFLAAVEAAVMGTAGAQDRIDPATGGEARYYFQPLASAGWTFVGVSLKREVLGRDLVLQREGINQKFLALLVVFCAFGLVGAALLKDWEHQLWCNAIVASFVMVAAIMQLWTTATTSTLVDEGVVRVVDRGGLRAIVGREQASRYPPNEGRVEPLIEIPVGVYVQSLEFASANNVRLTGLYWIRVPDDVPAEYKEDLDEVILPEAVDIEADEVYREAYPSEENRKGEVVGVWFTATLRQNFQFLRYPFDTKDVWIRFWSKALDRRVILVPDLDAYTMMNPGIDPPPGLDSDFVLAGWQPVASYFQFRLLRYNTDFGLERGRPREWRELYYTVDVRRNFVDSFVSDLIPLVVVACLLFGVLLTLTTQDHRFEATGFNFSSVLGASLALVFVVVVAHIQLRTMLAGQPIVYLEWFYFAMYIMVVAVSLNGWLVVLPDPPFWVAYRDNLLPRILFWPLLLGALLLVTMKYFYPGTDIRSQNAPSARTAFVIEGAEVPEG